MHVDLVSSGFRCYSQNGLLKAIDSVTGHTPTLRANWHNNAILPCPKHDNIVWLTMDGGEMKSLTVLLFHQLRCPSTRESPRAHRDEPAIRRTNYIKRWERLSYTKSKYKRE